MPTPPITANAVNLDLSGRFFRTDTVAASPSAATETIIATLTVGSQIAVVSGVYLLGYAAYTVGTNGVSVNLKIRQTDTSGTTIKATGATTATAANLGSMDLQGFDTAGVLPGQVYVLTMTVASANAASTVSAAALYALVI